MQKYCTSVCSICRQATYYTVNDPNNLLCISCLLIDFLFEMLPSLQCFHWLFPFFSFALCSAHTRKAIAWCWALRNGLFINSLGLHKPWHVCSSDHGCSTVLVLYKHTVVSRSSRYTEWDVVLMCSGSFGQCPAVTLSVTTGDRLRATVVGLTPDMNSGFQSTCQPKPWGVYYFPFHFL